jgi:hypothetical protein
MVAMVFVAGCGEDTLLQSAVIHPPEVATFALTEDCPETYSTCAGLTSAQVAQLEAILDSNDFQESGVCNDVKDDLLAAIQNGDVFTASSSELGTDRAHWIPGDRKIILRSDMFVSADLGQVLTHEGGHLNLDHPAPNNSLHELAMECAAQGIELECWSGFRNPHIPDYECDDQGGTS